ncbi:TPA: hypothetical protein ACX3A9_002131 [Vibrio parahaemolyticus]
MFTFICKAIFKFNRWKVVSNPPLDIKKCVMVGAPHTSNWDFVYLMAAYSYMGVSKPRFTIKKEWKKGFYQVALQAGVPILLGYLDYKNKEAGIGKVLVPTGDLDKDLREVYDFYNEISPKHPERYIKL